VKFLELSDFILSFTYTVTKLICGYAPGSQQVKPSTTPLKSPSDLPQRKIQPMDGLISDLICRTL